MLCRPHEDVAAFLWQDFESMTHMGSPVLPWRVRLYNSTYRVRGMLIELSNMANQKSIKIAAQTGFDAVYFAGPGVLFEVSIRLFQSSP
jgi:hypothetical protein